jgi:hypothetical protein
VRSDRRAGRAESLLRHRAARAGAAAEHGDASEWGYFHWISADILPPEEIAAAKRDLDELTYQQEYEASFVNFEGRAYYAFGDANKARSAIATIPKQPAHHLPRLQRRAGRRRDRAGDAAPAPQSSTVARSSRPVVAHHCVIGEVWIENNSNTPAVCRKILTDWKDHRAASRCTATPPAARAARRRSTAPIGISRRRRSAKASRAQQLKGFGDRVSFHVKDANPPERARVNAMNSAHALDRRHDPLLVDPRPRPTS